MVDWVEMPGNYTTKRKCALLRYTTYPTKQSLNLVDVGPVFSNRKESKCTRKTINAGIFRTTKVSSRNLQWETSAVCVGG